MADSIPEDRVAYNAGVITDLEAELLGPVERERYKRAAPWVRSVITDLIRRIANLRAD